MDEILLTVAKSPLFTMPDLEIDEFVPVVQVDLANYRDDRLVTSFKGPKVELSPHIDEALRTVEMDVLVAVPGKMLVTCTVVKGRKGTLDDDGIITPRLVGGVQGVVVEAVDGGRARYGEAYGFTVDIVGSAERAFKIELFANDDAQDANSGEFEEVLCGCVEFRSWPDVFSKADADRLTKEMKYIGVFAPSGTPEEYAEMYCMKAADRGISKLLENKVDFYSVDENHIPENKVHLGDRAAIRGDFLIAAGFVHSKIEFNEYTIDHGVRLAIKDEVGYRKNLFGVVTMKSGASLGSVLRKSIDGKPGLHVFYMSASNDFHTLLLVIDNRNTTSRRYEIYDQDWRTSSHGPFVDIDTGFERQTSWTFLNFYMKNGFNPDLFSNTTTRLWKIRRKPS